PPGTVVVWWPCCERARVPRCVAADHAAGVDDHGLPASDLAIGRAPVRPGRVGPGRDDRLEGDVLRTLVVEQLLDRPRDVALGAADEAFVRQPLEDTVSDVARLLQRGQFAL